MTTHAATSGTTREDTMSTRRTPEEMAQAALDTAQRKVERAQERVIRARSELADAQAARARAGIERDYASAHPLLKAAESDDVTA